MRPESEALSGERPRTEIFGREKPHEKPKKGRLPGAVGSRDRDEAGLFGELERKLVHRRERPSVGADKAFYEFFDAEDAHSGLSFTVTG